MADERALWDTLRKKMQGRWRVQRLEDKLSEGIQDLCYAIDGMSGIGFVELKRSKAWPKRATTKVRIRHYTPLQRAWIRRMGEFSGRVFLLFQVEDAYLLFDWKGAQKVGEATREELYELCVGAWYRSIDVEELTGLLKVCYHD